MTRALSATLSGSHRIYEYLRSHPISKLAYGTMELVADHPSSHFGLGSCVQESFWLVKTRLTVYGDGNLHSHDLPRACCQMQILSVTASHQS